MSHVSKPRHYDNPFAAAEAKASVGAAASSEQKTSAGATVVSPLSTIQLREGLVTFMERVWSDYSPSSAREEKDEAFLYEGVGGVAYMALHVERALGEGKQPAQGQPDQLSSIIASLPTRALQLSQRAADLCAQYSQRSRRPVPLTFYCGSGGVLATLVLAALRAQEHDVALQGTTALLALLPRADEEDLPNEILYGRAGFMHALLLVHNALSAQPQQSLPSALSKMIPALQQGVDKLFDQIIERGVAFPNKRKGCPMIWSWHDTKYLGAAHGVTGILYMLLRVPWRDFRASDAASTRVRELILGTVDYCIQQRFPSSGNFHSSEKDEEPTDRLVQWCHGAPGLALVCLRAFEVFSDKKYLQVACESAEVVWQRGLLRKGVGLCHGIGGNGYIFLRLFDVTRDEKWLHRAQCFASFALHNVHASELLTVPDCPSSLANGRAGFVCFAADLLAHMQASKGAHTSAAASSGSSAASDTSVVAACFPGMDLL